MCLVFNFNICQKFCFQVCSYNHPYKQQLKKPTIKNLQLGHCPYNDCTPRSVIQTTFLQISPEIWIKQGNVCKFPNA